MLRGKSRGSSSAAIIVLFVLLIVTTVVLIIFSPSSQRRALLNDSYPYDSKVLFSVSDVSIEEGKQRFVTEYLSLGDFDLDLSVIKSDSQIKDSFEISNNLIKEQTAKFSLFAESTLEDFYITFYVSGKKGDGRIKVSLNGKMIDSILAQTSSKITVKVPMQNLVLGENKIEISASLPIMLWETNAYSIADLRAYLSDRASISYVERTFVFDDLDFEKAVLYGYVTELKTSGVAKSISIMLNGYDLYNAVPPVINSRNPSHFEVQVPTAYLVEGINKISFEVEDGGAYSFDLARIQYSKAKENDDQTEFKFTINSEDFRKTRYNSYDCNLIFESSDLNKEFEFSVNGNKHSAAVGSEDIKVDVCKELVEGKNEIKILPEEDEDIVFQEVKLLLAR